MPEINSFEISEDLVNEPEKLTISAPKANGPVSMYSESNELSRFLKGKRLLAQAQPYEDDTSILDLEEDLDAPLSETTEQQTEAVDTTSSTSASEVPPEETKDLLDIEETAETEVTQPEDPGFFAKAIDFLKEKWMLIAGIVICIPVALIFLGIIVSIFNQSRSPQAILDGDEYPQDPNQKYQPQNKQQQQQQQAQPAQIIDNEPVSYIPPVQGPKNKSISEAISQIINIRNQSGK